MFRFNKKILFLLTIPLLLTMFQNCDLESESQFFEESSYDEFKDQDYVLIGDMYVKKSLVNEEDLKEFFNEEPDSYKKPSTKKSFGTFKDFVNLWPDGVLPITFENFSVSDQEVFLNYCSYISEVADIQCIMRTSEIDYINVRSTDNNAICGSSYYGKIGGEQALTININNGCLTQRVVLHELMHALGISHEQNRDDRNDFVNINWSNIDEDYMHNFARVKAGTLKTDQYDFDSIMHYTSFSFSLNKNIPAMERKTEVYIQGDRCNDTAPYYLKHPCDSAAWTSHIPYNKIWSENDKEILIMGYGTTKYEHAIYFNDFSEVINTNLIIDALNYDEISTSAKRISIKIKGQSENLFTILINNESIAALANRIKDKAESIVQVSTFNFLTN